MRLYERYTSKYLIAVYKTVGSLSQQTRVKYFEYSQIIVFQKNLSEYFQKNYVRMQCLELLEHYKSIGNIFKIGT